MKQGKPASVRTEIRQHPTAACDLLPSDDPDCSAPNRAQPSLDPAFEVEAEAIPLCASVPEDHPSQSAANAQSEADPAARPSEPTKSAIDLTQKAAAQLEMARTYLKQHVLSTAQELFDRVLADDPENQPAQIGCIDVALKRGDLIRATALAQQGLDLVPGNTSFGLRLARCLQRKGRIAEAIDLLEDLQRRAPNHAATEISLARAYLAAGRMRKTREITDRLLADTPDRRDALLLRIDTAWATGNPEATLRRSVVALRHHPDDSRFLDRKAHALVQCNRPLEALKILNRLSADAPNDGPLQARTARASLAVGRVNDARQRLQQAPACPAVTLLLAEMEEQAGDIDAAVSRLALDVESNAALATDPSHAILLRFCTLCLRKGQTDRARNALASATIDAENLQTAQLLQLIQVAAKLSAGEIWTANADAFAADLAPVLETIRSEGHTTLRAIAGELNARGIRTRRGGRWHVSSVRNLLDRLERISGPAS
jgi:predicted Zn-dependent protease